MSEIVVESYTNEYIIEVVDATAVTVENVAGTATVVEVPAATTIEILENIVSAATLEVTPATVVELETIEGATIEVITAIGQTGRAPELYSGAAPPSEAVGVSGDLYLVNTGATIGDLYQKTGAGWGASKGNLRGGIASVNGISGTNIVLAANNITTGVLPIAQVPTGTTSTTVALGNHLHTGVYEPVIAGGLTTQYWRGDKTWVVIDKASLGLSNVVNVDTSNADNITSGTLAFARHPTGTGASQLAIGNHNHDTAYVSLASTQSIGGTKTFSDPVIFDEGGADIQLRPGASDHAYLAIHARTASPGTRSAYIGYGGGGATTLGIINEITNGSVQITANGTGVITLSGARVDAPSLAATALRVGTTATVGYVLTADASGNATWQQTANIITPGTTAQYYRGDLTWQTLNAAAVGLGNVVNAVAVDLTSNQTIAGTKTFSSTIVGPSTGNTLRVGDDAFIADVNLADYIGIIGLGTATNGGIAFGGAAGFRLGGNSVGVGNIQAAGGLTITGAVTISGTITGPGSGLTALPATSLTGTIDIARIPTGTSGATVALGNHAHAGVYEPVISAGTTAQYYRGDKTWQTLNPTAVGLGNVANVAQVDLASGQTITGAKVLNNASNVFTGNGAALTALNATQLTTGTAPQARITPNTQRFVFTTGAEARPTGTTYVEWIGPVQPANSSNDDTWTDTSIGVIEDPVVSMPVGIVQMYVGAGAPTNWMKCDGTAISRSTYSVLFAIIGTQFGIGDGTTTFNLPNFTDRFPLGNGTTAAIGGTGGAATHALTVAELPAHTHLTSVQVGAGTFGTTGSGPFSYPSSGDSDGLASSSTGSGTAHNNMPPYLGINFIVKVL